MAEYLMEPIVHRLRHQLAAKCSTTHISANNAMVTFCSPFHPSSLIVGGLAAYCGSPEILILRAFLECSSSKCASSHIVLVE